MSDLIISELQGKQIRRNKDNWFNLGDLAEAGGKDRNYATQWLKTDFAKAYLAELKVGNSTEFVIRKNGRGGGIYAHYKVARRFVQFDAKIAKHVDDIVEGVVSSAPTAEQAHARLLSEMADLTKTVNQGFQTQTGEIIAVRKDVAEVRTDVANLKGDVASLKQQTQQQQKQFSKTTEKCIDCCLDDHYPGKCPCCDRPMSEYEIHHWRGKGGNDPKIAFPMRIDCHDTAERGGAQWHDAHESRYAVFQERLQQYLKAAGVKKQPKYNYTPSLFGDIPNDIR